MIKCSVHIYRHNIFFNLAEYEKQFSFVEYLESTEVCKKALKWPKPIDVITRKLKGLLKINEHMFTQI
jgi:hypothetical protein